MRRERAVPKSWQVGKGKYTTFLEYHIHEIPGILNKVMDTYVMDDNRVRLDSVWRSRRLKAQKRCINKPGLIGKSCRVILETTFKNCSVFLLWG